MSDDIAREVKLTKRQVVLQIAEKLREEARNEAPERTGELKDSIIVEQVGDEEARVGSPLKYSEHVHDGTDPHKIEAGKKKRGRRRKALKFSIGAQTFIRKSVKHPGTKPNPFFDRASDKIEGWTTDFVAEHIGEAVTRGLKKMTKGGKL